MYTIVCKKLLSCEYMYINNCKIYDTSAFAGHDTAANNILGRQQDFACYGNKCLGRQHRQYYLIYPRVVVL